MFRYLSLLTLVAIGALGLQACGLSPKAQESCNFVQNEDMRRVSWSSKTPVILYIDEESVPVADYDTVQKAADVWNKAVGREVIKIGGVIRHEKQTQNVPDGVNLLTFERNWDGDKLEQARTTIWWSHDRIYEADVKVNDYNFSYFVGENAVTGDVDLESLLIHEFGHVLGLKHTTTSKSVMLATLASATSSNPDAAFRRSLTDDDEKSITCEY